MRSSCGRQHVSEHTEQGCCHRWQISRLEIQLLHETVAPAPNLHPHAHNVKTVKLPCPTFLPQLPAHYFKKSQDLWKHRPKYVLYIVYQEHRTHGELSVFILNVDIQIKIRLFSLLCARLQLSCMSHFLWRFSGASPACVTDLWRFSLMKWFSTEARPCSVGFLSISPLGPSALAHQQGQGNTSCHGNLSFNGSFIRWCWNTARTDLYPSVTCVAYKKYLFYAKW